jgi:excisionase family DNA binding protein
MAALSSSTSSSVVTAGEAARRLGVAPITIQRWVDEGAMRAVKTAGGHRRIPVVEIRKRLAASRSRSDRDRMTEWLAALLSGEAGEVAGLLRHARERNGCWARVADEVAQAIVELGERWQTGDCSVFEEHMATEALRRAAAGCAAELSSPRDSRRALLTTAPGQRHTLGLSLGELVLAEHGWRSVWIGEGPPATEIPAMVSGVSPDLCVVAAPFDLQPKMLRTVQRGYQRAVAATGGLLLLAGQARWAPTKHGYRCRTFEELDSVLVELAAGATAHPDRTGSSGK